MYTNMPFIEKNQSSVIESVSVDSGNTINLTAHHSENVSYCNVRPPFGTQLIHSNIPGLGVSNIQR